MPKPLPKGSESARHNLDRIARLERRLRQLVGVYRKSASQVAEISALEWALPVLEKYVVETYGVELPKRTHYHKHEKRLIVDDLVLRDGRRCYLCNEVMLPGERTIDHVVPLMRGGRDDMTNYKLVHPRCNLLKGNMSLEDFQASKAAGELCS